MIDPGDLVDYLTGTIPRFMVPRYVEIVADLLRTLTAKMRKRELRDSGVGAGQLGTPDRRVRLLSTVGSRLMPSTSGNSPTGTPKKRSATKATSRNTYERVLDVATVLFAQVGYERTTVRAISDELGIESGSLYSHISTKEEMLHKIVERTASAFFDVAEAAIGQPGGAEERLRALCRGHISIVHTQANAVAVYYDNWRTLDEKFYKQIVRLRQRYETIFADVIRGGIELGEFRPLEVSDVVLVLLSTLNWVPQWYSPAGPLGPDEVADRLLDIVLVGLRA